MNDDTRTNDNELHQQVCQTFNIITKLKGKLEWKINVTLPALLPKKIEDNPRGLVTSSDQNENNKLPLEK